MSELLDHRTWALVDDNGYMEQLYEGVSLVDGIRAARDLVGDDVVLDSVYEVPAAELVPHALAANVARLPMAPVRNALKGSKLPTVTDGEVMSLTLEDAHARLKPFFPTEKRGKPVSQWQRLGGRGKGGMLENFLRENYKTQRRHPEHREYVLTGLNLAPNALAFQRMGLAAVPNARRRGLEQGEQSIQAGTFCASSNAYCRSSCLVYTGQNVADPYNNALKVATSVALIEDPVAFMRMLVGAIEWFKNDRREECNQDACFRLNVYSDLPWELIYPELFERFEETWFYDYTKVEGRSTPDNYDLTFSYAGTNWPASKRELERGRRLAVVFVSHRLKGYELPASWRGHEVIDGTIHDFRFTDPGRVIVGLRYKAPSTELLSRSPSYMGKALQARWFFVPTWVEDGEVIAAETPRSSDAFWHEYEGS